MTMTAADAPYGALPIDPLDFPHYGWFSILKALLRCYTKNTNDIASITAASMPQMIT
jgi:hypothetical protein